MRVLLQRVSEARVTVDDVEVGAIGPGLLLFVGVTEADSETELKAVAGKVVNLRVFEDADGRMNLSALDRVASAPAQAAPMIERFAEVLRDHGLLVAQGVFGAQMMVSLMNDGPVTIWIDSDDLRGPRRDGSSAP